MSVYVSVIDIVFYFAIDIETLHRKEFWEFCQKFTIEMCVLQLQ